MTCKALVDTVLDGDAATGALLQGAARRTSCFRARPSRRPSGKMVAVFSAVVTAPSRGDETVLSSALSWRRRSAPPCDPANLRGRASRWRHTARRTPRWGDVRRAPRTRSMTSAGLSPATTRMTIQPASSSMSRRRRSHTYCSPASAMLLAVVLDRDFHLLPAHVEIGDDVPVPVTHRYLGLRSRQARGENE